MYFTRCKLYLNNGIKDQLIYLFLQGDFETAASFYKSSLELDPNFEPAITKLRVMLCFLLYEDKRSEMEEILRNIL